MKMMRAPACRTIHTCIYTQALRDGGFLDGQTKEVVVEATLLNLEFEFLVAMRLAFTWQVGGSITWDYAVRPLPLDLYAGGGQAALEVVCVILGVIYLAAELQQMLVCVRAQRNYFTDPGNWIDGCHLALLVLTGVSWRRLLAAHHAAVAVPLVTSVLADPEAAARLFEVDNARAHTWLAFQEGVAGVAAERAVYAAVGGTCCLLFVLRLLKDLDFQPKTALVSRLVCLCG